jgi:hypothetical protein
MGIYKLTQIIKLISVSTLVSLTNSFHMQPFEFASAPPNSIQWIRQKEK